MTRVSSFSDSQIKGINYFTEEYIKQLLMEVTNEKVSTLKPFVGAISYPGLLFPTAASNVSTQQFAATTYIGLMQMVFPAALSELEDQPAYTVLEMNLDGVERSFVTIAGGDILAGDVAFKDFVKSLYPAANNPIPFNESAIHVVRNLRISGSKFGIAGGKAGNPYTFEANGYLSGSHTKDYSFCIAVSGYSAIID